MRANLLALACLACVTMRTYAQTNYRISETAGDFLTRARDARAGGMGYTGTASAPDANAAFWNAAKLPDAPGDFGVSATYSPWLAYLMNGAWLGYATAYKKLGNGQVVSASVQYLSDPAIPSAPSWSPGGDIAIGASYAKQLGRHFSAGMTLKYISSDIGSSVVGGNVLKPARAMAGDIGVYYKSHSSEVEGEEHMGWAIGVTLANIGPKMKYGPGYEYFLPTTLRLGGAFRIMPAGSIS